MSKELWFGNEDLKKCKIFRFRRPMCVQGLEGSELNGRLKLGSIDDFLRLLKAMNVEHTIHDTEVDKSTLKYMDCCKPFSVDNQTKYLVYPSHNTCFGIYAYIGLGPKAFNMDINLNQSDSWKATEEDAKVAVLFERNLAETGIEFECITPKYIGY